MVYTCHHGSTERRILIHVTDRISLSETELEWQFVRASGPGGQNVNKVSSAVELRFDVTRTDRLPAEIKDRLRRLAGSRMTGDGVLVIQARRFRSQARNREDALQRLIDLVAAASVSPKLRKPTAPSRAAKRRRLEAKKTRAATKQRRGAVKEFE
jgi:ribosome-associated protein